MSGIVGISAGRPDKITDSAVRRVLEETGMESTFFSLGCRDLQLCRACNGCVQTNRCLLPDGLDEILAAMEKARGVVFGAPRYWRGINARARGFWERLCFSGRHRETFPFQDMPAVMITVSGSGEGLEAQKDLETFMGDARLRIVDRVDLQGEYACFTCGYGPSCLVGGYVSLYEPGTQVTRDRTPRLDNQSPHDPGVTRDLEAELRRAAARLVGEVDSRGS